MSRRTWVFWFWLATLGCSAADDGHGTAPASTVARPGDGYPVLPEGLPVPPTVAARDCQDWAQVVCRRRYDCGDRRWDACHYDLFAWCGTVKATTRPLGPCLQAEATRACPEGPPLACEGVFR